jgi:tetratricopeptide (TPR) repeat protein
MAKNAGSLRSTDNLLQVAGFLKQADKLVRDRNYSSALDQIARARAKDPNNSYAEAYEQRVKLLLSAFNTNSQPRNSPHSLDSGTPHSFSQHLESIANLAILEAHRTASVSMQQDMEKQKSESGLNAVDNSVGTPKDETESRHGNEVQISHCIRSAEEMFRTRRFDEALNILTPAILLDPLNKTILELEHRIHNAQEEEIVRRLRRHQEEDPESGRAREMTDLEIQKCILRATHLLAQKEFSEALMVIGQGYLLDPYSVPLATCEKMILAALGIEPRPPELQSSVNREAIAMDNEAHLGRRPKTLDYLDKAQNFLSDDRFAESLFQVMLAMIAARDEESTKENERGPRAPKMDGHRESTEHLKAHEAVRDKNEEDSQQITDLIDKAKRLAGKEEYDSALEQLLQASFLIPANGSLAHLDREVARKFMEYYQLMRIGRSDRPIQHRPPTVTETERESQSRIPQANKAISPDSQSGKMGRRKNFSQDVGSQLEFEDPLADTPLDRITQTTEHLLRSLRHLDNMRLVEASVEGELASLVDDSRKDVCSYTEAVSNLARKAKAQVPLNSLHDQFDMVRQQAKSLVHNLCYEKILDGIDQVLQVLPANSNLLKDREEAELGIAQSRRLPTGSLIGVGIGFESSRRKPTVSRKTKKDSFDQMGLSFSGDLDGIEDFDESRANKKSDVTDMQFVQKSMQRGSETSSGSAYLGN